MKNNYVKIGPYFEYFLCVSESKTKHEYSPKTQTSFESMYHNYYEVPNEYLVPNNVLHNEPICKYHFVGAQ